MKIIVEIQVGVKLYSGLKTMCLDPIKQERNIPVQTVAPAPLHSSSITIIELTSRSSPHPQVRPLHPSVVKTFLSDDTMSQDTMEG